MIEQSRYRSVMSQFATGVAVVAARDSDGRAVGMTANAVTSVSLEPPLLLVCIQTDSTSYRQIVEGGSFAVNILREGHEEVARRFAEAPPRTRFDGIQHRQEATGSPVLEEALAWLDCRVDSIHPAGDHAIVLGEVVAGDARAGRPLVFFGGTFGSVSP